MVAIPRGPFSALPAPLVKIVDRFRGPQPPQRWVGVDIGSQSIKVVELEQTPAGIRLIKQLIQDLPLSAAGQPVDRAGWLQSALREFDAREVHLAVCGPEVVVRRVRVPPMSARELPEAVKWQVKDEVPFPIQDAVLDFRVLGEVWEKDLKQQDILVAAASTRIIEGLVQSVERAGVRVASIVPTPLALWSCAATLMPETSQGSIVLIEFGANATHVAIVKNGHVRVVRDLAVGSATVTEALVGETASDRGRLVIDQSKAEALKRRYGVLAETPEGTTEEGVPLFHLASLMRPVLENFLTEVSRFLDFYKVQMEEGGIARILLCGGGAGLKQIQPFLADGLGVTVELFNPLTRITDRAHSLEPEQITEGGPRLAVAAGLALDRERALNLLPAKTRRARASVVSRRVWVTAAKGLGGIALACYLGLQLTAFILDRQVQHQEARWVKVEPTYTEYMRVTSSRKALEGGAAQTQQFLAQQPVWDGLLKELGEVIPANVELDELSVESDGAEETHSTRKLLLRGHVVSQGAGAQGSISQFVEALDDSIFFSAVTLAGSELRTGSTGTTSFEIEGWLE